MRVLKNIDSAARAQFLKLFFWVFCPLSIVGFFIGGMRGADEVGFFIGGLMGVIMAGVLSLVLSFIGEALYDTAGSVGAGILSGNVLNGGGGSLREQLAPELQRAKYFKRQKQFDQALIIVNGVLEKDMAYAEALFMKAVILWEGFGDSTAAKECLGRIMAMEPVESAMFRPWAASLYEELGKIK
jgi:hypothetical protein